MSYVPQCLRCLHLLPKAEDGMRCSAYPNGIPSVILANQHDHRQPYKGDHGITFQPIDKAKDEAP